VDESLDHMTGEEFLKVDVRLDGHDRKQPGDQLRVDALLGIGALG
jgi:hypothetical protein